MSKDSTSLKLHAQIRTVVGKKVKQLRREGLLPAVVYGHNKESRSLILSEHDFSLIYKQAGQSTLVELAIDEHKAIKVLIHSCMRDIRYNTPLHVDFYQVNLKEKLTTSVPLEYIGQSDAVELEGGIFMTVKDEVEIECLPDNLPQHISVDISSLKSLDDVIRISDIILPEGVVALGDAEEIIASITEPISEEELAELEEAPAAEHETAFETTEGTEVNAAAEEK